MLIRIRPTSLALVGVAALAAAGFAQSGPDSRVVAEVEGRSIHVVDLRDRLAADRKRALAENRLDAFGTKGTDVALDALVDVKVYAAAARAAGLADRADVRHAIDNAIDEVLAETVVAERMQRVRLDEPALRAYYDAHAAEFATPGRARARHIVVKTRDEATRLLGRLRRNADFAELARASNIDTTRESGGELGWVSRGVMVKAFDQAVFSLRLGDISPVIETPYGFHIVQVEEIEPGTRKPFATVAPEVRERILHAELQSWKAELRRKHAVKVHDAVLGSLR